MSSPNDLPPTETLDDPALLAEIEAEFAELTKEIERISAAPRTAMQPDKSQMIAALRDSWRKRLQNLKGDRPEWRQRLDETLGRAVDRLIEDGIKEQADGKLAFQLSGDVLKQEGAPVLRGLLEGFAHVLEDKFPSVEKLAQATPGVPPTPVQALFATFGSALAGALKSAIKNSGTGPSQTVDIKIEGAAPVASDSGVEANAKVDVSGDQKLSAVFEYDSRAAAATPSEPAAAAPATPSQANQAMQALGQGANAFFQTLMQGIGQAVSKAVAPLAAATGGTAVPPPAPAAPGAATPDTAKSDASATSATAAAPNPLGNLGQQLAAALQRALANPSTAPLIVKGVQPAAPAAPPATPADAVPTSEGGAAPKPPAEGDSAAGPAPDTAAPQDSKDPNATTAPSIQIDLAGLLSQILGKKPPTP